MHLLQFHQTRRSLTLVVAIIGELSRCTHAFQLAKEGATEVDLSHLDHTEQVVIKVGLGFKLAKEGIVVGVVVVGVLLFFIFAV